MVADLDHCTLVMSLCSSIRQHALPICFLFQLEQAKDESELRALVQSDDYEFLYDCGIHQALNSINLSNRSQLIGNIAKHYSVILCKAEIDQIIEGLTTHKVLDLIRENPATMRQLFVCMPPQNITADYILQLFMENFSPLGSNSRSAEEATAIHWVHLVEQIG